MLNFFYDFSKFLFLTEIHRFYSFHLVWLFEFDFPLEGGGAPLFSPLSYFCSVFLLKCLLGIFFFLPDFRDFSSFPHSRMCTFWSKTQFLCLFDNLARRKCKFFRKCFFWRNLFFKSFPKQPAFKISLHKPYLFPPNWIFSCVQKICCEICFQFWVENIFLFSFIFYFYCPFYRSVCS